tara:strand:- start:1308 stop:1919 length:612 start_codon:yes stop_codon:yes gene_type:complete
MPRASERQHYSSLQWVTSLLHNKTLDEVIEEADKTISITTYNNYIKYLSTLFEYAIRGECIERNPFSGMKLKKRRKLNSFRSVFTQTELERLFKAVQGENIPFKRWLLCLGFYTGARLGELCQLRLSDFKTVNGVLCIHIQATQSHQKPKGWFLFTLGLSSWDYSRISPAIQNSIPKSILLELSMCTRLGPDCCYDMIYSLKP